MRYLPKCGPEEQAQLSAWEAAIPQSLAGVHQGIGLDDPFGSLPIWDIGFYNSAHPTVSCCLCPRAPPGSKGTHV